MIKRLLMVFLLALGSAGAQAADEAVEALGKCLGDNTNGKERKDLAKWVFLAMASHPDMKPLSTATTELRDESSKTTAELFTRLIVDSCVTEVRAAVSKHGTMGLQLGFTFLGQLAMQELMTNQEVQQSMSNLERYVDQKRVNEALQSP